MADTCRWSIHVLLLFDAVGQSVKLEAVAALRAGQVSAASTLSSVPRAPGQGAELAGRRGQLTTLQRQEGPRGILMGADVPVQSWWAAASFPEDEQHYSCSYDDGR